MSATPPFARKTLGIPDDARQASEAAVQTILDQLLPHLTDLGTGDRRGMPRMGDKTEAFVSKALSYARAKPEYRPGFVDIDKFQDSVDTIVTLRTFLRPLTQVVSMLEDSITLAGSAAYEDALATYASVKSAAKRGQPGASTMYDDLAARFQGIGRTSKKTPPAANPAPQE